MLCIAGQLGQALSLFTEHAYALVPAHICFGLSLYAGLGNLSYLALLSFRAPCFMSNFLSLSRNDRRIPRLARRNLFIRNILSDILHFRKIISGERYRSVLGDLLQRGPCICRYQRDDFLRLCGSGPDFETRIFGCHVFSSSDVNR